MRRRILDSWIWLLALYTVALFMETIFWGQVSAFTPLYLPALGIAADEVAAWTGAIAAISAGVGIPFLPLWGALADRYARQPLIARSFVAHLLAGVVCLLAGNVWVFVLGRALMSFAFGNSGLMMTTLSERAPAGRLGLAFGILNSASPVGAFLGPLAGGPIVDRWGFPALLAINVALMLGVTLSLIFGYRDAYRGVDRGPLLGMAAESVKLIAGTASLRSLFIALFMLFAGWVLALTYIPLAVAELYQGADANTAVGVVLGAGGLTALVAGPLAGALADRLGHWRVLIAGSLISVILWPLPGLAPELISFGAAWAALNGALSAVFPISFTVMSGAAASEVRGRVMAFAFLPINVGSTVGPALGSLVAQWSVFAIFPLGAALTAVGIGLLVLARRQSPGRPAAAAH